PISIWDSERNIVGWFLPGILTERRQWDLLSETVWMSDTMDNGMPHDIILSPARWRQSRHLFREEEDCLAIGPGCTTLSPGWMATGHWKVCSTWRRTFPTTHLWLRKVREHAMVASAILAMVHPEMARLCRQALIEMCTTDELDKSLQIWGFYTLIVSVIANRESPIHHDTHSSHRCLYDMLVSCGGCPRTVLELPTFGLRCQYIPGSMSFFSGAVVAHGVSRTEEDRLSIAGYMKLELLDRL
ncbi:hypothetical protein OF83DRAFT_1034807, partial [Amylostereum chailletii]